VTFKIFQTSTSQELNPKKMTSQVLQVGHGTCSSKHRTPNAILQECVSTLNGLISGNNSQKPGGLHQNLWMSLDVPFTFHSFPIDFPGIFLPSYPMFTEPIIQSRLRDGLKPCLLQRPRVYRFTKWMVSADKPKPMGVLTEDCKTDVICIIITIYIYIYLYCLIPSPSYWTPPKWSQRLWTFPAKPWFLGGV